MTLGKKTTGKRKKMGLLIRLLFSNVSTTTKSNAYGIISAHVSLNTEQVFALETGLNDYTVTIYMNGHLFSLQSAISRNSRQSNSHQTSAAVQGSHYPDNFL